MCVSKWKKHYDLWLDQFEIHPIWLSVKDVENGKKHMDVVRKQVQRLLNFYCILLWVHFLGVLLMNYDKYFSELAFHLMHTGSLLLSISIIAILSKFKLAVIDYTTLFVVSIRIISTFLVLNQVESKMPGFDLIDKKELNFTIPFIAAPALILACVNFKLDLLTTIPLTLISSYIMTQRSYDPADDNMACFQNSDVQAGVLS